MKSFLFILLLLFLVVIPASGQLLSDKTGLVNRLNVESGGYEFEVETVSNFDIVDHQFVKDEKRLTIFIKSGLENNLGELIIPKGLLSGNFTFYLNNQPYEPKIKSNEKISFVTINFTGSGNNKIDIIATNTIVSLDEEKDVEISDNSNSEGGGCLIATVAYGSELAPQIQQLREIRDQKLMKTTTGQVFLSSFHNLYYSFSPQIADYGRENPFFKESVKLLLTPMISSLTILNYLPLENDLQVLGAGISIITLNLSMYLIMPTIVLTKLRK